MSELDHKKVEKTAHLARLSLSAEEMQSFVPELKSIVNMMGILKEVTVEGVEPLVHPLEKVLTLSEGTRPDQVEGAYDPYTSPSLTEAPEVEGGGYRVPPVLGGG